MVLYCKLNGGQLFYDLTVYKFIEKKQTNVMLIDYIKQKNSIKFGVKTTRSFPTVETKLYQHLDMFRSTSETV